MDRKNFLASFAVAPLSVLSQDQLEKLQEEDSAAFILHAHGKTYALAFKVGDFEDPLWGFHSLAHAAEAEFIDRIVMYHGGRALIDA